MLARRALIAPPISGDGVSHMCRIQLEDGTELIAKQSDSAALEGDMLGDVDKFEPVSGGGEMDHAEEAAGKLVVARRDGAIDLEVAEHALDAVALLIERAVVFDLYAAV
ncbi:hypothetical protein SAMN06295912_12053 [Sphingomonas laterariae]|uniref:Uncharacterized protein n=1 Tax=Edaphosphingomonas laterariae TaxID=861865 RepID=A0A239I4U4_9SPHN|nr:hypothetical protein SAMN06295912_12053 [Sphingomonas laterariae]